MCLSAPASFVSSAILAAIGTTLAIRVKSRRHLPLAFIPWFFAIQQCAEGIVWLYLPEMASSTATFAKDLFLFFAYAFWPIWIPFSLWVAEVSEKRKQAISAFFGMGLVVAVLLIFMIPQTTAHPYHNSIQYLQQNGTSLENQLGNITLFFYGVATLLPLFVSSLKKMWILGISVALAGVAIELIDRHFFVSLWCFFAACFSIGLFFILPLAKFTKS
jgi:hypothetical protein